MDGFRDTISRGPPPINFLLIRRVISVVLAEPIVWMSTKAARSSPTNARRRGRVDASGRLAFTMSYDERGSSPADPGSHFVALARWR